MSRNEVWLDKKKILYSYNFRHNESICHNYMQTLQQNASIITSMNTEQISDVQLDRHYLF